jgi:hypothetical protein
MSALLSFLTSETGLAIAGMALTGLWTFFKGTDLWARISKEKYSEALLALEAGVNVTYETYVREIKAASEDGKLTDNERKVARERARQAGIDYAKEKGVDLLKVLGESYIDVWIEKILRSIKGVQPLPSDVKAVLPDVPVASTVKGK